MRSVMCMIVLCCLLSAAPARAAGEWSQFRGPSADGHSSAKGLPLQWNETKNLRWKTAIPGQGWSSPVVWDNQVWLTTALNEGRSLRAICVDLDRGQIKHDIELFKPSEPGKIHQLNSYASPTPVIDADRVYCHFGNFGIAAIDTKTGKVAWKNEEFGDVVYTVGPGSSPILYKDLYIVHCDGINQRFILALHKDTGKVAWKTPRTNPIKKTEQQEKCFSTPLLIQRDGKDQLISIHADAVTAYDPAKGQEIWRVRYDGYSNVAAPVAGHNLAFINTGYDTAQFWAVRLGGKGDVTKTHVAWKLTRGIGKRVSPLLVGDELYLLTDEGVMQCLDAKTGEQHWQERIGGQFCASPILAEGRIYLFDQAGVSLVLQPGKTFKKLAENRLGDGFMASPAVAGKAFFLRSKSHLYRVEE